MRKIQKILVGLLCLTMLFAICACGDDEKNTESGKNTSAVSNTTSGNAETEKTGSNETEKTEYADNKSDDGFILPEDGKIEFGKNNKKSKETTGTSDTTGNNDKDSGESSKDNTDKDSSESGKDNTDKDSGNTSSETTKPKDTTKPTESETTKPTESEISKPTDGSSSTGGNHGDDSGWGDVHWN